MIEENAKLAEHYRSRSVAEQNSLDLAWGMLMEPMYRDLLTCICPTGEEVARFRQLLVNSVMATDIADKEVSFWTQFDDFLARVPNSWLSIYLQLQLKELRNQRWSRGKLQIPVITAREQNQPHSVFWLFLFQPFPKSQWMNQFEQL